MRSGLVAVVLLGVVLVASSVGLVRVEHERRALFVELRSLERARDAMQVEWGRLRLEQSTWSTHERIEKIARERLELRTPGPDSIVLVTP